jgi:acyl-CoA thioester hydrolase
MDTKRERVITYPVTVQFEDVDSYRIVHHTKLVTYLERGRVHFLSRAGFDIRSKNHEMVLYTITMTFKKPARFLDELIVSVYLQSRETFKCTLAYRITRDNELIAKAETEIAFVDTETKEIVPIPDSLIV